MSEIKYQVLNDFNDQAIKELYNSVAWTVYTEDMDRLMKALNNSLLIYGAFDGEHLIGLVRVVGDGYTIIYVQDLLVNVSYQRLGIASNLLKYILSEYSSVRQIILLTDNDQSLKAFYNSQSFEEVSNISAVTFAYKHKK